MMASVCERTAQLTVAPDADIGPRLEEMGTRVGAMIEGALNAFLTNDLRLAERVLEDDGPVDQASVDIFERLSERMRRTKTGVHDATRLQSIVRYLERIGDHATNLAELVIFMIAGKDVRHPGRLSS